MYCRVLIMPHRYFRDRPSRRLIGRLLVNSVLIAYWFLAKLLTFWDDSLLIWRKISIQALLCKTGLVMKSIADVNVELSMISTFNLSRCIWSREMKSGLLNSS
jgi:hypothetical protein